MKKFFAGIVAVVAAIGLSAFSNKYASQDPIYYRYQGSFFEYTVGDECVQGSQNDCQRPHPVLGTPLVTLYIDDINDPAYILKWDSE